MRFDFDQIFVLINELGGLPGGIEMDLLAEEIDAGDLAVGAQVAALPGKISKGRVDALGEAMSRHRGFFSSGFSRIKVKTPKRGRTCHRARDCRKLGISMLTDSGKGHAGIRTLLKRIDEANAANAKPVGAEEPVGLTFQLH